MKRRSFLQMLGVAPAVTLVKAAPAEPIAAVVEKPESMYEYWVNQTESISDLIREHQHAVREILFYDIARDEHTVLHSTALDVGEDVMQFEVYSTPGYIDCGPNMVSEPKLLQARKAAFLLLRNEVGRWEQQEKRQATFVHLPEIRPAIWCRYFDLDAF